MEKGSEELIKAYAHINPKYGPMRADVARYLVIYYYGGWCFDCKSGFRDPKRIDAFKPLPPLVFCTWDRPNRLEVLTDADDPHRRGEICNWGFGSVAKHPIWLTIIQECVANIEEECQHIGRAFLARSVSMERKTFYG